MIAVLLMGCGHKEDIPPPASVAFSPGPAAQWDMGSYLLRHPLPEDIDDGFMELHTAPEATYGIILARNRITLRSHEYHDLILYGHRGTARFHVGEKDFTVSMGDILYIPRGAVYSAEGSGPQLLQFFAVYSPRFDGTDIVYHEQTTEETDQTEE